MKRNLRAMVICLLLTALFSLPAEGAQTCRKSIMAATPDSVFTLNGDGTVTHNTTGLMWMRCALGQEWDGKTCRGTATDFSWADALKTGVLKKFAGYSDWRLPNKNELESIVEDQCASPAINTTAFPATPSAYFWTSSPYAGHAPGAWSVDFGFGTVNASVKNGSIYVRLVRDKE